MGIMAAKLSGKPTCESCRYFDEDCCKRRSPVTFPTRDPITGNYTRWPTTYKSDWCGEWELKQTHDKESDSNDKS